MVSKRLRVRIPLSALMYTVIMRDPNRIDPMIDFLRGYWKANPDLRLAQIIGNAFPGDAYYVEDDELLRRMKEVAKKSSLLSSDG